LGKFIGGGGVGALGFEIGSGASAVDAAGGFEELGEAVLAVFDAGAALEGVVDGEARGLEEPAGDGRALADGGGLAGEDDEDGLGDVFGEMAVANGAQREGEQPRAAAFDDAAETCLTAGLHVPAEQRPVIHSLGSCEFSAGWGKPLMGPPTYHNEGERAELFLAPGFKSPRRARGVGRAHRGKGFCVPSGA
jgi:hypothetical protein